MTARIDKYISVFNIGLQNTFVYRWHYFLRALFGLPAGAPAAAARSAKLRANTG